MSSTPSPTAPSTPEQVTSTFQVTGMTCDHCVRAVTSEITQIQNVTGVTVHLSTGQVVVTSDQQIDTAAVAEAVDEAGYQLA